MKYVFLLLFCVNIIGYSQDMITPVDNILNEGGGNSVSYIQSVNITGNLDELVIPVGFPDLSNTLPYPTLVNNSAYPVLGEFEDGTLLSDYIVSQGGSIPEDLWYEPALNHYFNTESGGLYNVNFNFIKKRMEQDTPQFTTLAIL